MGIGRKVGSRIRLGNGPALRTPGPKAVPQALSTSRLAPFSPSFSFFISSAFAVISERSPLTANCRRPTPPAFPSFRPCCLTPASVLPTRPACRCRHSLTMCLCAHSSRHSLPSPSLRRTLPSHAVNTTTAYVGYTSCCVALHTMPTAVAPHYDVLCIMFVVCVPMVAIAQPAFTNRLDGPARRTLPIHISYVF
jgi:hypothetical protein